MKKNIVLIGMPGAGKSTVGVLLAKSLGMDFCDTDILIQKQTGTTLQETINSKGLDEFLKIENSVLAGIKLENTVIATGGSAVYGKQAMENLCKNSIVIYLKMPVETIKSRLHNITTRGIALKKGDTIESLFAERNPLYLKYSEITVESGNLDIESTVTKIIESLYGC